MFGIIEEEKRKFLSSEKMAAEYDRFVSSLVRKGFEPEFAREFASSGMVAAIVIKNLDRVYKVATANSRG